MGWLWSVLLNWGSSVDAYEGGSFLLGAEICAIGRIEGGANGPKRRCSHHPHSPRRRPWSPKGGGGMGGVEELRWELISPSFHHYHTIAIAPLLNS